MSRNALETLIGAVVLLVAIWFVAFAYTKSDVKTVDGYSVTAVFTGIGSLKEGADVRVSGIKVGSVLDLRIDPETYLAEVTMAVDNAIKLPLDTMAQVSTEGLLGGNYVRLDPGGEEDMIAPGGRLTYTQAAPDIIGLITQLVYNPKEKK